MANRLIKISSGFTVIGNTIIREKRRSYKSLGLYAFLLSRPDDWEFSIRGLASFATDGKASIQAGIWELEKLGYLERIQSKNKDGLFDGYDWNIHITPLADFPATENQPQIATSERFVTDYGAVTKAPQRSNRQRKFVRLLF